MSPGRRPDTTKATMNPVGADLHLFSCPFDPADSLRSDTRDIEKTGHIARRLQRDDGSRIRSSLPSKVHVATNLGNLIVREETYEVEEVRSDLVQHVSSDRFH